MLALFAEGRWSHQSPSFCTGNKAREVYEVLNDKCVGELGYWMSAEGVDHNIDVVFKSFNLNPVNCLSRVSLPHAEALSYSWLCSVFSLVSFFVFWKNIFSV